jgi:Tol biopolymer transport system component
MSAHGRSTVDVPATRPAWRWLGLVGFVLGIVASPALVEAQTTTRVSVATGGIQSAGNAWFATLSADGRYVAFESDAGDLVAGDTNGVADVFLHDRRTSTTTRVSVSSAGAQGTADSEEPAVSADARLVAFSSNAPNLVAGDTNGASWRSAHDTGW